MTHRLLSLTLLLSGFAATHAPTEAVAPALGVWEQVNNPKATDRSSASTTISSVHPADSSSAQSTPKLIPVAEPVILAGIPKDVEWYTELDGIYTLDLQELVAEVRANWDNCPVGGTIGYWKRMKCNSKQISYSNPRCEKYLILLSPTCITISSCWVKVNCFDSQSANAITSLDFIKTELNLEQESADRLARIECLTQELAESNNAEKAYWTKCLGLAKDYNPETAHTTPTALKLPEMETAPALLKELLQVLKSSGSTNTDKLTRLPSAVAPDKAPLEQSPVLRYIS